MSEPRKSLTQKQRRGRGNRVVVSVSLPAQLVEAIDKDRKSIHPDYRARSRWIENATHFYFGYRPL